MQTDDTRAVVFEMCGNDALQARSNFAGQNGTCDYSQLDVALANCTLYQEKAMAFINANANAAVRVKVIANLYYPGYTNDDREAGCTDSGSGLAPNEQDVFLGYLARMNWRACHFATQYGFQCADDFAEFMGADYDTNADGKKDVRALRYREGEGEDAYVERITVTLRSTIRDANAHLAYRTTTFDYLQSDDTHPTFEGPTVSLGVFGGSARGSSPPRFADDQYRRRKNPIWRRYGHDRMGHALAIENPVLP
jgi:hypothetical protein